MSLLTGAGCRQSGLDGIPNYQLERVPTYLPLKKSEVCGAFHYKKKCTNVMGLTIVTQGKISNVNTCVHN